MERNVDMQAQEEQNNELITPETPFEGNFRIVIFWDTGAWIGMCLERYIGTQGSSMDELYNRLNIVIEAERQESVKRTGKAFSNLPVSPKEYFDMWDKAFPIEDPPTIGPVGNCSIRILNRES